MKKRILPISWLAFFLANCLSGTPTAQSSPAPLPDEGRLVFLGDSNTHAGHYVAFFDCLLRTARPNTQLEVLNLGLSSETACGLSEPTHPFPRPDVHERLDRVLARSQPDIVVACYGMNDGIYHPFSPDRLAAYQDGILRLVRKVRESGARILLLTPPPFDPLPMEKSGKLRDRNADGFAWNAIYRDYDQVMKTYSEWILSLKGQPEIEAVIDIYHPMASYVAKQRESDPSFTMSGDGVHFNELGHRVIAESLARHWGLPTHPWPDAETVKVRSKKHALLRDAWLTHCVHLRPGGRPGLPLEQAQAEALKLEKSLSEKGK